ncbi:hypothetical protein [Lacticaseibacillus camelliae]|uniref:hypothetical protein n=1 Tax=Lacticaseibacillus camelliae TaxID=381742 RepID=UPI000B1904EC|nr:hypothetical protein [Lacticaseibacillus camelliae]
MKTSIKYHQDDPWRLSEATFDPAHLGKYEAIFALGNGYLARAQPQKRRTPARSGTPLSLARSTASTKTR